MSFLGQIIRLLVGGICIWLAAIALNPDAPPVGIGLATGLMIWGVQFIATAAAKNVQNDAKEEPNHVA